MGKRQYSDAELEPANPADFGYSRASLRLWHGMSFGAWLGLMRGNWGAVSPSRYGLVASVAALSLGNSVLKLGDRIIYGRRVKAVKIEPAPVFILGHWRSGTTWLHQLMSCDPGLAAPTSVQCFTPETFLMMRAIMAPVLRLLLPKKRPMDNVEMSASSPEEDEHSLALSGAASAYRTLAFPCNWMTDVEISPRDMGPGAAQKWHETWLRFLRRVQFANPGKRLVLKSPTHTARVAEILAIFPDAKFIHIVRDPYRVYMSRENSTRAMIATQSFQDRMPTQDAARPGALQVFGDMHSRYTEDAKSIPEGNLVTLHYEDLRSDPAREIAAIYETLDLGNFADVAPHLSQFMTAKKGYVNNSYDISAEVEALVYDAWRPYFETYGYKRMSERRAVE